MSITTERALELARKSTAANIASVRRKKTAVHKKYQKKVANPTYFAWSTVAEDDTENMCNENKPGAQSEEMCPCSETPLSEYRENFIPKPLPAAQRYTGRKATTKAGAPYEDNQGAYSTADWVSIYDNCFTDLTQMASVLNGRANQPVSPDVVVAPPAGVPTQHTITAPHNYAWQRLDCAAKKLRSPAEIAQRCKDILAANAAAQAAAACAAPVAAVEDDYVLVEAADAAEDNNCALGVGAGTVRSTATTVTMNAASSEGSNNGNPYFYAYPIRNAATGAAITSHSFRDAKSEFGAQFVDTSRSVAAQAEAAAQAAAIAKSVCRTSICLGDGFTSNSGTQLSEYGSQFDNKLAAASAATAKAAKLQLPVHDCELSSGLADPPATRRGKDAGGAVAASAAVAADDEVWGVGADTTASIASHPPTTIDSVGGPDEDSLMASVGRADVIEVESDDERDRGVQRELARTLSHSPGKTDLLHAAARRRSNVRSESPSGRSKTSSQGNKATAKRSTAPGRGKTTTGKPAKKTGAKGSKGSAAAPAAALELEVDDACAACSISCGDSLAEPFISTPAEWNAPLVEPEPAPAVLSYYNYDSSDTQEDKGGENVHTAASSAGYSADSLDNTAATTAATTAPRSSSMAKKRYQTEYNTNFVEHSRGAVVATRCISVAGKASERGAGKQSGDFFGADSNETNYSTGFEAAGARGTTPSSAGSSRRSASAATAAANAGGGVAAALGGNCIGAVPPATAAAADPATVDTAEVPPVPVGDRDDVAEIPPMPPAPPTPHIPSSRVSTRASSPTLSAGPRGPCRGDDTSSVASSTASRSRNVAGKLSRSMPARRRANFSGPSTYSSTGVGSRVSTLGAKMRASTGGVNPIFTNTRYPQLSSRQVRRYETETRCKFPDKTAAMKVADSLVAATYQRSVRKSAAYY